MTTALGREGVEAPAATPPTPAVPPAPPTSVSTPTTPEPASRSLGARSRSVRLWSLVPVTAAAACVGLGFQRVFEPHAIVPLVVASAIAPVLLATACSRPHRDSPPTGDPHGPTRRPRPLWPSLAITVVCWILGMSATLFRDDAAGGVLPSVALLREIGSALLDAPHSILTMVPPVPAEAEGLVLVAATVWMAAFAGAEIALRTDTVAAPALPALLLFAVPVALGSGGPGSNVPVTSALVAMVGLLLVIRRPGNGPASRALAVGVPVVAVLALLAGAFGPALPGAGARQAPDLHKVVDPPAAIRLSGASPLDRVSAWLRTPDLPLFTVSGPVPDDRHWRLAVFDDYDGVRWTPADGMRPTEGRVPEAGGAELLARHEEKHRYTLSGLDGIWLPAADRPSRVTSSLDLALSVQQDSGVLAVRSAPAPGTTYEVVSDIPRFDPARLQYLQAADEPSYTVLPEYDDMGEPIPMLDVFRQFAEEATAEATFPYQQALQLASWLRTNYSYDVTAVPGHSYRALQFFLESSKEGTSEQFATTFAVMARTLNLPTRVVVGFSAGTDTGGGTHEVRGGDVMAWPEIRFEGVGWVPFFPTPGRQGDNGKDNMSPGENVGLPEESAAQPPQEVSREELDRDIEAQERGGAVADEGAQDATSDDGFSLPWWVLLLCLVGAVLAGYVTLALVAPTVERRRRRRGSANERVLGAWQQIGRALVRTGMRSPGALTAEEIAAEGAARLDEEPARPLPALAALVNDLAYGGRRATVEEADEAWRASEVIENALGRGDTRGARARRVAARLHIRTVTAVLVTGKGRRA